MCNNSRLYNLLQKSVHTKPLIKKMVSSKNNSLTRSLRKSGLTCSEAEIGTLFFNMLLLEKMCTLYR